MLSERKSSGTVPISVNIDIGSTGRHMSVTYPDGSREMIRGKGFNGVFQSAFHFEDDKPSFDTDAHALNAQTPALGAYAWKGELGTAKKFVNDQFTAEEIETMYIAYMILVAEKQLGISLKGLVVFASRSYSVSDVGSMANVRAVEKSELKFGEFISEHSAVVYGFIHDNNLSARPDLTWFVKDSGGWSVDLSTGKAGGGRIDNKATRSIPNVGGIEMSRRLGELVLAKGAKLHGLKEIDPSKFDADTLFQFQERIELGKVNLSTHKSVQFTVTNPENRKVKAVQIVQEEYHTKILDPMLKPIGEAIDQVLADAKLTAKDIQFLIGSGAPMQNRYLCDWLGNRFGRPMETDVDTSLAVIRGVAAYAVDELTRQGKTLVIGGVPEIDLTDQLPAMIAVMMVMSDDPADLQAVPLFDKDSTVPSEAIIRGRLIHKDQTSVDIKIAQAPRPYAKLSEVKIIGHGKISNMPREPIMTDRLEFRGKLRSGGLTDVLVIDTISQLSVFITAQSQN